MNLLSLLGSWEFNAIPMKVPITYFIELEQIFQKLFGTPKDPKQPQQS